VPRAGPARNDRAAGTVHPKESLNDTP